MKLTIANYTMDVESKEAAIEAVKKYGVGNLGKLEFVSNATLDGEPIIAMGSSMVEDITIETAALQAINNLEKRFGLKHLSANEILEKGYDTGAMPKLKEALMDVLKDAYGVTFIYAVDEY